MDQLKGLLGSDQVVNLILVPIIAWTFGFIKDQINAFFDNRDMKKAKEVYVLLQKAVDAIYKTEVKPIKDTGEKLTTEQQDSAMGAALGKVFELANKGGITSYLPSDQETLKAMIEQVIVDRKKGTFVSSFLGK